MTRRTVLSTLPLISVPAVATIAPPAPKVGLFTLFIQLPDWQLNAESMAVYSKNRETKPGIRDFVEQKTGKMTVTIDPDFPMDSNKFAAQRDLFYPSGLVGLIVRRAYGAKEMEKAVNQSLILVSDVAILLGGDNVSVLKSPWGDTDVVTAELNEFLKSRAANKES